MSSNHLIAALVAVLSITSTAAFAETATQPDASKEADNTPAEPSQATPTHAGSALLSHMVTGSFDIGAPANVAGVLRYCQAKDWADDEVAQTSDALVEAQGGSDALSQEPAFAQGERGVLTNARGRRFTLVDTKDDTARQLCERIADKARASFLSGA